MYTRIMLCLLLLPILILLGLPVQAQDSYQDFEKGLNLTDTQKRQVEGIKRKYIDEWQSLKNESARKRIELRDVDRGSPAGRERANRLESELYGIHASRENLYRQYRGEVSGVLNEQQRGRYDKFLDGERPRRMMSEPPPGKGMTGPGQRGMMPEPRHQGHGR
jgi:Spy/CpxP family protein refolding chaperone